MIDLYVKAFAPAIFDEHSLKITDKEVIDSLKKELIALRQYEEEKLGSCTISFEAILDCEESRYDNENIKRCFWINLFNYKILSKILEVFLASPKTLNLLTNCTMFVSLMVSVKVKVNGEILSCYEIFRTMLRHDDIHLLTGPFEEPVRKLEEMPESVRKLAVTQPLFLTCLGLFLPIRKWADFTVYEKGDFEHQLRKVIQNNNKKQLNISPENFLIRIPKFFFWRNTSASIENRLTTIGSKSANADPEPMLK